MSDEMRRPERGSERTHTPGGGGPVRGENTGSTFIHDARSSVILKRL